MKKKLSPPIEIILLTRITPRRLLILVHRAKRIIKLFIKVTEQAMKIRILAPGQHLSYVFTRACGLSICLIGKGEMIGVRKIILTHLISGLEQWDGLAIFLRAKIKVAE